jgi:glycerol-3-phosphate cytidylyltransferase
MIGFTAGTFDLMHAGHVLMFKECKKYCDYLVVGLQTNPNIDRSNKNKPVESIVERQIKLNSCKYVDKVIVYETEKDLEDILLTEPIDIRFIGEDHLGIMGTGLDICKDKNIEIRYTTRKHNFSSSELRERIKHG